MGPYRIAAHVEPDPAPAIDADDDSSDWCDAMVVPGIRRDYGPTIEHPAWLKAIVALLAIGWLTVIGICAFTH